MTTSIAFAVHPRKRIDQLLEIGLYLPEATGLRFLLKSI